MNKRVQKGFTLVEIAISFLIIALLLGGALMTLGAQNDVRAIAETQRTLQQAQEALLGFAVAHGRLPCPATDKGIPVSSQEAPLGGEVCSNAQKDGFIPAATLGITPVDPQGFLVDAWGNRIRYSITTANDNAFTKPNQMKTLGAAALTPDLFVCSVATVADPPTPASCPKIPVADPQQDTTQTNQAVAVLYSIGKNGIPSASPEEQANIDGGRFFVDHPPSPSFDDIVTWLSPYTLYNRMIAAGAL
jgi:type II secretory pathway pseudopilin PulG